MKREMLKYREAFKRLLDEECVYDVFLVNLYSNIDFDTHCLYCEYIYLNSGGVRIEYIKTVVPYADGSGWHEIDKKWEEIFKRLKND